MRIIRVAFVLFALSSTLLADSVGSEVVFANIGAVARVVSGKLISQHGDVFPFRIAIQPLTSVCIFGVPALGDKVDVGFSRLISGINGESEEGKSPPTRQLVITLENRTAWNAVSGPSIDNRSKMRDNEEVITRFGVPAFIRIECQIDPR